MKRILFIVLIAFIVLGLMISCRPPELEGAFVDYNAGRYDNALALAEDASKKYPDNAEAWFLLGMIYGKKSNFDKMVGAFDKSLAIGPAHKADIVQEKNYHFQTKYNDAVSKYNAYTKLSDKTTEKAQKIINSAIADFTSSTTIKPKDYNGQRLMAVCYSIIGDSDKAQSSYQKLTEIYPDTASSWLDLGSHYYNQQEYDNAVESLKKATKIDPNNSEALTYLAQSYDFGKKREKAIDAYKNAIKVNPEEKALPFNLGLLYIKAASDSTVEKNVQKEYLNESIVFFQKVIDLDNEIKESYQLKSTAEIRLENWEEAKNTILAGLEFFPEDGDLWTNLGVCYARLGNKEKAEEAFAKAKEITGEE